jgi:hypothetical protein
MRSIWSKMRFWMSATHGVGDAEQRDLLAVGR